MNRHWNCSGVARLSGVLCPLPPAPYQPESPYHLELSFAYTIKTADLLQAKVRVRGLGLRPRLYAGPVCDTQRR